MGRSQEEKRVFKTALALMGGIIAAQCQVKLQGNQDANSITEVAVLKVSETGEIRDLYIGIWEIPETVRN